MFFRHNNKLMIIIIIIIHLSIYIFIVLYLRKTYFISAGWRANFSLLLKH